MHPIVHTLIRRDQPVELAAWHSFWDALGARRTSPAESIALLASLSSCRPEPETLQNLARSLLERHPAAAPPLAGTVNIVGTGGGPRTFNISTAAAFVAAAFGVPVIKSGSRAYHGSHGSIDLLDRLGIRPTSSAEGTASTLDRFGIAFTGNFVYPVELSLLARAIFPLEFRTLGAGLNPIGPFLADLPVAVQVTGVSGAGLAATLRSIAGAVPGRTVWLCDNDLDADELISFADNRIDTGSALGVQQVRGDDLGLLAASLDDLRPVAPDGDLVGHFVDVVSGRAGRAGTETVALNAAALGLASGRVPSWRSGLAAAQQAISSGAAADLLGRLRSAGSVRGVAAGV